MTLNNLQELQMERERLHAISKEHEFKLKEDYAYLSENAGHIIIDATISAAQYRLGSMLHGDETEIEENGEGKSDSFDHFQDHQTFCRSFRYS